MTVAQLRRALKGLKPDRELVWFDGAYITIHGQAEIGITPAGKVLGVRLMAKERSPREREYSSPSVSWKVLE